MTGGFLSAPIMGPNRRWTVLQVSILAGLLLTLNADSEDSNCEVEVRVVRNTEYEACLGEELRIFCKVIFCNNLPPTISWSKREENNALVDVGRHVKAEWELVEHLVGKSILIFQKIGRNDSGVYQCQSQEIVSHNINVIVHAAPPCSPPSDGQQTNFTKKNDSGSTTSDPKSTEDLWRYIYVSAGIAALVVAVIATSVVSMHGCKGKSKKKTQTENHFIAVPMVEQPFPHARRQASPKGSPSAPPCQRSTRRKTPPSRPPKLQLPRDSECVYSEIETGRERGGNVAEEGSSIVYAALNHQLPGGGAARPPRPKEEMSEYAAIRV